MEEEAKQVDSGNVYTSAKRILLVGPSGSGKTVLMVQMVRQMIKDGFVEPKRIILFCVNQKDPSLQPLLKDCTKLVKQFKTSNLFKDIDESLLLKLYDSQETIKEKMEKQPPMYLCIFDDQVCSESLTDRKSNLRKFLTMGRHMNISTVFCIQKYKATISPILRENMNMIAIGNLSGMPQIEDIIHEYSAHMGKTKKEAFLNLYTWYEDAVKYNDHHGFLVIHPEVSFGKGRFQRGLTNYYYDKKKSQDIE